MSNIYVLEPPTNGKVCMKTTVGDIDIELWSKECPKACRNFVQLCMEGYYDGTIFHRIVKGFIVQGGDPVGDGTGGNSVYGAPFKDEFHQRLKFSRRGLVAMANSGPNDNGSQFFFTLDRCPELDKKHTIFGKVEGPTLFNMLRLAECDVDDNERPLYPPRTVGAEVLKNPFDDIVPREKIQKEEKSQKKQSSAKATKNFNLLSFGDEAEEDENEIVAAHGRVASKSAHDLTDDPRLSDQPAVDKNEMYQTDEAGTSGFGDKESDPAVVDEQVSDVRSKIAQKRTIMRNESFTTKKVKTGGERPEEGEEDEPESLLWREEKAERAAKLKSIKAEVRELKKSLRKSDAEDSIKEDEAPAINETVKSYQESRDTYLEKAKAMPDRKTSARASQTLALLAKFKEKLSSKLHPCSADETEPSPGVGPSDVTSSDTGEKDKQEEQEEIDQYRGNSETGVVLKDEELDVDDVEDDDWMSHLFKVKDQELKVAKDANMKSDEQYDIHDPRNAMNKRRREQASAEDRIKKRRV